MKTLFVVEPDFFDGHLSGARIPVFLKMAELCRGKSKVFARLGTKVVQVSMPADAPNMDLAYGGILLGAVKDVPQFDSVICQKGQRPDVAGGRTALMLNDARGRQAINQLYELLSGRFGFDAYRLSAPIRFWQGMRRDRAQIAKFDTVYVQTEAEARFLRRFFAKAAHKIEIFSNKDAILSLYPNSVIAKNGARPHRFLLAAPPGIRRAAEYAWFLRRLRRHPELLRQLTVLAPDSFRKFVPQGVQIDTAVADFSAYLQQFDCVLVPTKHYTGLNNRVFQAAAAGCDVIASAEALEGLVGSDRALLRSLPRSFIAFRAAMETYPNGAVKPETVLGL